MLDKVLNLKEFFLIEKERLQDIIDGCVDSWDITSYNYFLGRMFEVDKILEELEFIIDNRRYIC